MRERILIACTTGEVDGNTAGLLGEDWPWSLLAGTPEILSLYESDSPEAFADGLVRSGDPPDCGGLWIGECELGEAMSDVGGEWDLPRLRWRDPTPEELALYLAGQTAPIPEAIECADRDLWLVRGRA